MSTEIDGTGNMRRLAPSEAVALCRFAKACCPQQAFDEYTPDAWGELLSDLRFEDCKTALTNVAKRQPFVSPAEIRAEVKRIRFRRLDRFGPFDPPPEASDRDYHRYITETNRRIADGELTREQYDAERAALTKGDTAAAIAGTFRTVDESA